MKIYNTLNRKQEDVKPIHDKQVTIYSCGPTVYDQIHIGNLSSFIYADLLKRTLKVAGYDVKHVMNFTDVDDKTIARSQEKYPDEEPMVALKKLTEEYISKFLDDMKAIGNQIDDIEFMAATDNIGAMQKLIAELYHEKFAYITEDGVYFSIEAYKKSGKKYGQLTDVTVDSTSRARIRNDEYDKESAHDFALWKLQSGNEPSWGFELDGHQLAGRPGWHIECSAMSTTALGQPFDIHTGGIDLIFPHHENEIAQSTAGKSNELMAKIFFHNEHLLVDGRKMSKSLNNFFTLRDIAEKGFSPLVFRLLVLQGGYRNQSNFTWDNLEAAQNRYNSWGHTADLVWQPVQKAGKHLQFEKSAKAIQSALENDLNTPKVLSEISHVLADAEHFGLDHASIDEFSRYMQTIDDWLGLELSDKFDISNDQKQLIKQREQARDDKDWQKSDDIRNQLQQQGLGIRDTEQGTIWFRL